VFIPSKCYNIVVVRIPITMLPNYLSNIMSMLLVIWQMFSFFFVVTKSYRMVLIALNLSTIKQPIVVWNVQI